MPTSAYRLRHKIEHKIVHALSTVYRDPWQKETTKKRYIIYLIWQLCEDLAEQAGAFIRNSLYIKYLVWPTGFIAELKHIDGIDSVTESIQSMAPGTHKCIYPDFAR